MERPSLCPKIIGYTQGKSPLNYSTSGRDLGNAVGSEYCIN
jgi:hypothetical protein